MKRILSLAIVVTSLTLAGRLLSGCALIASSDPPNTGSSRSSQQDSNSDGDFAGGELTSHELRVSPFGLHAIGKDLEGSVETGASWTRAMVLWKRAEPQPGSFENAAGAAERINSLTARGFEVVPRLISVNPWANSERINRLNRDAKRKKLPMRDFTYIGMPRDIGAYRRFVTSIVEMYDGDGVGDAPGLERGVRYWQVENEWDWRWKGSPEEFVEFLEIAYQTIKAADPEAIVVLGGISKLAPDAFHAGLLGDSYRFRGRTLTPATITRQESFIEQNAMRTHVLEHGHPYFDVISFHQYGRYAAIEQEVEYLRSIMRARDYEKPLWITEAGGPFTGHGEKYTDSLHAQEVLKYYVTAIANGVEVVFWSTYEPTPTWGDAFINTALLDIKGRKKPGYHTYKLMVSKLREAAKVERLFASRNAQLVAFTRKTGEKVYVAWSQEDLGDDEITRIRALLKNRTEGRTFEVTRFDGQTQRVNDLHKRFESLLSEGPVFLEVL